MGRQPWRLLVLPLLLLPLFPPSLPLSPLLCALSPLSAAGLAGAGMRKPVRSAGEERRGGEEEQRTLIHVMAPVFLA